MEKKKETRGRKKLPISEKLTPITIRVKYKHLKPATKDAELIVAKYKD